MAAAQIQLQRDSEVFFSTKNFSGGDAFTSFTPANTWKVEVLAGFAASQASGTQDITTLESGLNPDRSSQRFNINLQPADWNFQAYLRPTGMEVTNNVASGTVSGNAKPVSDWYLWQALLSNTAPANGGSEQSVWQTGGKFDTVERAATANVAAHTPNFGIAQENHIYIKMGNVFYQIANAAVESAEVNGDISSIATTTWTGKGTNLVELTGAARNAAVSVFGGILNNGTVITGNSNSYALTAAAAYHPWSSSNVFGVNTPPAFIKNRLASLVIQHTTQAGVSSSYTFPVTNFSVSIKNNLTYLTPEEMSALNQPIGQFAGSREIMGTISAYLRGGSNDSAQFLRNIANDTRTSIAQVSNANLKFGGATAPYVAFLFPAVQFDIPVTNVQDVIGVDINFKAQETTAQLGSGGEVVIFAKK